MIDVGGIELLLDVLRLHEKNPIIQEHGCFALYNLTISEPCTRIVELGGIPIVQKAIENNAGDQDKLKFFCKLSDALVAEKRELDKRKR